MFAYSRAENGGIRQAEDDPGKGKSVNEVFEEKHPDQIIPNPDVFLFWDVLPTLVDDDVSAEHIIILHSLPLGVTDVSASDAAQRENPLLKHGGASEN